jgi:hypothetical protein
MEPPPSDACAIGTIPAATAAVAPRWTHRSSGRATKGLRVRPHAVDSVVGSAPNSGVLVRPAITRPAARRRATSVESTGEVIASSLSRAFPLDSVCPAYGATKSLSRNGTPVKGPSGSPAATVERAWSNHSMTIALIVGFSAVIRSIAASSSSSGDTSPDRTRRA